MAAIFPLDPLRRIELERLTEDNGFGLPQGEADGWARFTGLAIQYPLHVARTADGHWLAGIAHAGVMEAVTTDYPAEAGDDKNDSRNELRIDVSGALRSFASFLITFGKKVAVGGRQLGQKTHRVEWAETKRGFGMFDRFVEAARIGLYEGAEGEDGRRVRRQCQRPFDGVE